MKNNKSVEIYAICWWKYLQVNEIHTDVKSNDVFPNSGRNWKSHILGNIFEQKAFH